MDANRSDSAHPADSSALLWLWLALLVTLFISALGALVAFCSILVYGGAVTGYFGVVEGTPQYELFQAIQRNPGPRLALDGFNLVLWTSVLIGATRLMRLRERARVFIKTLLVIDLFVTLGVALWPAVARWIYERPVRTEVGVDLVITTAEVLVILILSHPRVVAVMDIHRARDGEIRQMRGVGERWPRGPE